MRSRRPLSINNSLVHGICNYSCLTCGVNKPGYRGSREFQPLEVTAALVRRVEEAARSGIRVRYLANSGDGEPTLHPEFRERMGLFGRMLAGWSVPGVPAPEVSVVTNGERLLEPGVLEAVAENALTLIVSFPTPEPGDYGRLTVGRPERGAALLGKVLPGIGEAMRLHGLGLVPRLHFHVSPPEREAVRRGFPRTVELLSREAARAGLTELSLVLFPATSNRTGLVASRGGGVDFYPDLFRAFDGRSVNGVRVRMSISYRRFFPRLREVLDLVRSFSMPCMWNAHLFVTAGGESICCNDQAMRSVQGNVLLHSIDELMVRKEAHRPDAVCAGCDQRPERMRGSLAVRLFALASRARLALAGRGRKEGAGDACETGEVASSLQAAPCRRDAPRGALPAAGSDALSEAAPRGERRPIVKNRLTRVLSRLEKEVAPPAESDGFVFAGGRYRARVANDRESREQAYRLVYRLYLEKEYVRPNASRMWVGPFDARPETVTLLVERQNPVPGSEFLVPGSTMNPGPAVRNQHKLPGSLNE